MYGIANEPDPVAGELWKNRDFYFDSLVFVVRVEDRSPYGTIVYYEAVGQNTAEIGVKLKEFKIIYEKVKQ